MNTHPSDQSDSSDLHRRIRTLEAGLERMLHVAEEIPDDFDYKKTLAEIADARRQLESARRELAELDLLESARN